MPHIRLVAGNDRFDFELLDGAPKTAAWLAGSLPLGIELRQSIWSGESCVAAIAGSAPALETPMTSVYPGQLALLPDAREEGVAGAGLFVGYGTAELRGPRGRLYGTPVARLVGPVAPLRAALEPTRTSGAIRATLTVEG